MCFVQKYKAKRRQKSLNVFQNTSHPISLKKLLISIQCLYTVTHLIYRFYYRIFREFFESFMPLRYRNLDRQEESHKLFEYIRQQPVITRPVDRHLIYFL